MRNCLDLDKNIITVSNLNTCRGNYSATSNDMKLVQYGIVEFNLPLNTL